MWTKTICLVYLGIESFADIKNKNIKALHILIGMLVAISVSYLAREVSWKLIVGGAAIGIAVTVASFLSRGRMGLGDGLSLIITGIFLGFYDNISILFYGSTVAGVYALILLIVKKKGNEKIAFLPFLLTGYVITLILNEVSV